MTIDTASIIISAVSLLVGIGLSVTAILLSIYFFSRSKDAQTDTSNTLTKINTQVDHLSNINDKLFGKALASLSQIAKQKVGVESTAVAEQTAAAIREGLAGLPEHLAGLTERRAEERPRPPEAPGGENQISDHQLSRIPDPFTSADLKREYIGVLAFCFSAIGWVNNYGRQAAINFTQPGPPDALTIETANNLNTSAEFYKNFKQFITELREEQPELFDDHPGTAQIDATINRLDEFIQTYDETVATLWGDAAPGT